MDDSFQLDHIKVKHAFSRAVSTYDSVTQLQRNVGKMLLTQLEIPPFADTVLDLGCGTGFLTTELLAQLPCRRMVALDLALPMLQAARTKIGASDSMAYVCAHAKDLPFSDNMLDAIFSNVMLQWCVDLNAVFSEIRRVLKPGGQLVFSIFGPDTLQELKRAWAFVDDYSHVNYFYNPHELECFLVQSGFCDIKSNRYLYTSQYDSVMSLMKELKAIGAHNVNAGRNKHLTTKGQMLTMVDAYPKDNNNTILATFDVITITAHT